ncbi:S41 family peptidase [Cyclobacterium sp.]|uniref:S41 family peptidase n=1 Tax=Cyclobacterium sp. TaxID=1966343 RepID=UPI001998FB66|nr:S41 family peptidase [Cyclobacterium sp.]MBD3627033.1 PD40 domain-containing protein [Cyclobacterium sp.]
MKVKISILYILLLSWFELRATAQIEARIAQYPDVSTTSITFSYGGDIWIVPKNGGLAQRLTSANGEESFPRFSPDGSEIAFSANYDGNVDVYVMPSKGGVPKRITHHGMSDRVVDWHPDGNHLIFASGRESEKQRFSQFYKASSRGGLPDKLPVPYGEFGMLSPDGQKMVYTPKSRAFRTWKRYTGGMTTDIFIFDLENFAAENISNSTYNDEFPMWAENGNIYFLSDRGQNQRSNIWRYDIKEKSLHQITHFMDFDVHFPSLGSGDIVFEAAGKIYLLDLGSEEYEEVAIQVSADLATLMPRKIKVEEHLANAWLAYDGNRAVVEARGELFSVPAKDGAVINLSQSPGVAERYPSWSPDGRYIAYWSDRTGEYELTIRDMESPGEETTLSDYGPGYRYRIFWSPDSEKMAFIDKTMTLYIYDHNTKVTSRVDQMKFLYEGGLRNFSISWSPDSRYLTYEKDLSNRKTAIAIYDYQEKALQQATSGFYDDQNPVFDPEGKFIFFITQRNFDPVYSDFEGSWVYVNSSQLAALPLSSETPSPISPKNDHTPVKDETEEASKENGDTTEKKKTETATTTIDWDGMEERLVILPLKAGNYRTMGAAKGKVTYLKYPVAGTPEAKADLVYYDVEERKEHTILTEVGGYQLSANGEKLLVNSNGSLAVIPMNKDQKIEDKLPLSKMEMTLDPKKEWKQLFMDTWRFERDFFYDPNMHGVNWEAMKERYEKLLNHAITRWDVNYILGELIAEISASHTYRGGGDTEKALSKQTGYLGIDWGFKEGAFYIKKIIRAAAWDTEARSPLAQPGTNIKEGDFILAVNGIPLDADRDPWAVFEGLAEETVELTVNQNPEIKGARKVLVKTLADETRLRNLAWIESNRKKVAEATGGRIGYIYVPSTGQDGQEELARMFYAQFDKEGLIIDERFNNGGQIPDRFIELLNRPALAFWAVRDGQTWQWPPVANFGPKVMLINGWSGSGGDAFPDYFKKAGLGPLIGTRTWGGLIGISGAPNLIDGGNVTVPTFRMYDPDGQWFREGYGVDPDIKVPEDPTQLAQGTDPQLEKAIEEVLRLLENQPNNIPAVPAYEDK